MTPGYASTSKVFRAKAKDGKLLIADPEAFHEFLKSLGPEEKDVELVVQPGKETKKNQNQQTL